MSPGGKPSLPESTSRAQRQENIDLWPARALSCDGKTGTHRKGKQSDSRDLAERQDLTGKETADSPSKLGTDASAQSALPSSGGRPCLEWPSERSSAPKSDN